jgi:hypothetical protein
MTTTKVNLANTVEGILPVANGGTGTSTGAAPGGSTTQVQYNNAGAFGGDSGFVYTGGNVGIGTSSPSYALDARSASAPAIRLSRSGTAGQIASMVIEDGTATLGTGNTTRIASDSGAMSFSTGGTSGAITGGTERMRIDSSGNVMVGGTTTASATGYTFVNALGSNGGSFETYSGTARQANFFSDSGSAYFGSVANIPLIIRTNNTERMRLDSSGNVGIGTTSPRVKLDISGSVLVNGYQTSSNYAPLGVKTSSTITTPSTFTNAINIWNGTTVGEYSNITFGYNTLGLTNAAAYMGFVSTSATDNGKGALVFGTRDVTTDAAATERMRIDSSGNLLFNSGYGSAATAYGCRAWVNFNGTGTVAIRASGNVSSITDNGTGDYTVNFTTALPDANYSAVGSAMQGLANANFFFGPVTSAPTTSAFRFITLNTSFSFTDSLYVSLAFHR